MVLAADFSVTLQAEGAILNGPAVAANHAGFEGDGFVDYLRASGDSVRWTVTAPETGSYELSLRYALGVAGDRPLALVVNGETVETSWSMPGTGGWNVWESVETLARLRAGENTIEAVAIGKSGANVDSLKIVAVDQAAPVRYEAEEASLHGAVVAKDHGGYTGSGFVDFLHATGDYIEWNVEADRTGDHELTFRYALSDSSTPFDHNDRPLTITVDGDVVDAALSFPRTGSSWTNWGEVRLTTRLTAGENRVRIAANTESGANVDHLRVKALTQDPAVDNPGSDSNQPPRLAPIESVPNTDTIFVVAETADQAGATEVEFVATATDDGPQSALRFRLEGAPAGAVIDAKTGAFRWTLPLDDDGYPAVATYSVKVIVTDQEGYGLSDERYVYIEVSRPSGSGYESAPTAYNDVYTLFGKSSYAYEAADGLFANDTEASPDYVEIYDAPTGLTVDSTDGSFDYEPAPDAPGIATFTYRIGKAALDGSGILWSNLALVTLQMPKLDAVKFVVEGTQGTLKEALPVEGQPTAFAYFPDAPDLNTRNTGRNIVRVRIEVSNATAPVSIFVRAVDVDDPSYNKGGVLDYGDSDFFIGAVLAGGDNRGRLDAAGTQPQASRTEIDEVNDPYGGYQGRIRVLGTNSFAAEGKSIEVRFDPNSGKNYVEVELATTYAPGDNFRVLASFDKNELEGLIMKGTTIAERKQEDWQVPSTGEVPNFAGKASPLLTIWRRLHIEQDHMAKTEGDKAESTLKAAPAAPANGQVVLATNLAGLTADEYEGGYLRTGNKNFEVLSNTADGRFTVKVRTDNFLPAANDAVVVFQDDWGAVGDAAPITKSDTTQTAPMMEHLQESFDRDKNRFADAFMMPTYGTLDRYDSAIPAMTHLPADPSVLIAPHYGSAGVGTNFFWATYLTSAFEGPADADLDPKASEPGSMIGVQAGAPPFAIVYFGTSEDPSNKGLDRNLSLTAAHEIGHALGLAFGSTTGHRDVDPNGGGGQLHNLMSSTAGGAIAETFFDPIDIAQLRRRLDSPR